MKVVELDNVGIEFRKTIDNHTKITIGQSLVNFLLSKKRTQKFWALKDISFSLHKGEVMGVIGNNGAGKSTLLKILCGVLYPDTGSVDVRGNISSLLSLGAGILSNLSGKENIYLNGMYMGLSKKEIDAIYDDIVSFSELEDFIHTQIKHYSSGMRARLGFSVAAHVKPDILIIDEVLGAGDKNFRTKAEKKMKAFMKKANAIILVTHNTDLVYSLCDKCLLLEKGKMKGFGPAADIVDNYLGKN